MLPHTEEDAEVFTRFVPAFEAWKIENIRFLNLKRTGVDRYSQPVEFVTGDRKIQGRSLSSAVKVAEMIQTGQVFEGWRISHACNMGKRLGTF
jgi:hypothetical protein